MSSEWRGTKRESRMIVEHRYVRSEKMSVVAVVSDWRDLTIVTELKR